MKKALNDLSKEELVSILIEISKDISLDPYLQKGSILKSYKNKMDEMFFPRTGTPILSLTKVFELINEFKMNSNNLEEVYDLKLFYVECCLEFIKTFGMMGSDFNEQMISVFREVVLFNSNSFEERFDYIIHCFEFIDPSIHQKLIQIKNGSQ